MAGVVLIDASPLIVLSRVGGLAWLPVLFGCVHVPLPVRREVLPDQNKAGEPAIRAALGDKAFVLLKRDWKQPQFPYLGDGEAACIRAGLHLGGPSLLLMDDRAGRVTAVEQGLRVAGTAAIVAMAKQRGLIPPARTIFEQLLQMDFRLSAEVIRAALEAAGERTS